MTSSCCTPSIANKEYIFSGLCDYVEFISNNAQLIDVKKLQPCILKYNHASININETWDKIDDITWSWLNWFPLVKAL